MRPSYLAISMSMVCATSGLASGVHNAGMDFESAPPGYEPLKRAVPVPMGVASAIAFHGVPEKRNWVFASTVSGIPLPNFIFPP